MDLVKLSQYEVQHHSVAETQRALHWAVGEIIVLRSLISEFVNASDDIDDAFNFRDWFAVEDELTAASELAFNELKKAMKDWE